MPFLQCISIVLLILFANPSYILAQSTPADPDVMPFNNATPTWAETIAAYEQLAESDARARLLKIGVGDVGRPIHAFILSNGTAEWSDLESYKLHRQANPDRMVLLVNNAIHPGEPCGVDASITWLRSLIADAAKFDRVLSSMDVVVIPMYNVGGALNRNCCTRTNQDGPESYGFRGNARNLDLNRDFIKMDSRNSQAFVRLFQAVSPHIFVDTHTTNGADYPYAMTLISTQPDKAGPVLGELIQEELEPFLYRAMEAKHHPMSPYVNSIGETPEEGIAGFLETPRYSTGYTALFGCVGFTAEAHMLKPFPVRVSATIALLESIVDCMLAKEEVIVKAKRTEQNRWAGSDSFDVRWERSTEATALQFKGYASRKEISSVTGDIRLKYDPSETWEKEIPYYNQYIATVASEVPDFFIIPQAWHEAIDRLTWNGVHMTQLPSDTLATLRVSYLEAFNSTSMPYEGHHMNSVGHVRTEAEPIQLFAGDWLIETRNQPSLRYLMEVLDPRAHDSFFTWNFFDSAMQQKEHFSAYVFEETAARLLASDEALRQRFNAAMAADSELSGNSDAQLNWLYRASQHYEGSVNRYPVYRSLQ